MNPSRIDLEEKVAGYLRIFRLPLAQREYRFHPERKWRFDFAWPERKVALEVEGGIWVRGAHTRGAHFISDCDKYNAAGLMGWRVFRVTEAHIRRGNIVELLQNIFVN